MLSPANNLVVAVFDDPSAASKAVEALHEAHFTTDEVGMLTHRDESDEDATDSAVPPQAVIAGASAAGLAGTTLGMSPLIPDPSAAGAAGLALTAIVGYGLLHRGLNPVLTEAGMDEDEARYFDTEYRNGRGVVVVKPGERVEEASEILKSFGGRGRRAVAE